MIYLAAEPRCDNGPFRLVKIGFASTECEARVASCQTGNPRTLELVATLDGERPDELRLHRAFKNFAVRGEWFLLSEHMLRVARRHQTALGWLEDLGDKVRFEAAHPEGLDAALRSMPPLREVAELKEIAARIYELQDAIRLLKGSTRSGELATDVVAGEAA